jgi:hypothetical protein
LLLSYRGRVVVGGAHVLAGHGELRHPPVRIDLLTSISGVTFRQGCKGRAATRLGGLDVGVLGVREVVENKRAAGGLKELADVALLVDGQPGGAAPVSAPTRAPWLGPAGQAAAGLTGGAILRRCDAPARGASPHDGQASRAASTRARSRRPGRDARRAW